MALRREGLNFALGRFVFRRRRVGRIDVNGVVVRFFLRGAPTFANSTSGTPASAPSAMNSSQIR